MMTYWTLEAGGVEKDLVSWGITGMQRNLNNQAPDEVTFEIPGMVFDDAPLWTWGAAIKIRRNRVLSGGSYSGGTQWFVGTFEGLDADLSAQRDGQVYLVTGPWKWLADLTYRQAWSLIGGSRLNTHVLLNAGVSIGGQVAAVVSYAAGLGAPMQMGTITPTMRVPMREERDMTCASAIQDQLRMAPDAVCWFDYSTSPPTLHCKHAGELTAVNVPLPPSVLEKAKIKPRYDLQLPCVVVNFEVASTVDGRAKRDVISEIYPPTATGNERGALVATFDLQGEVVTRQYASIWAEALPWDTAAWWKKQVPHLSSNQVANVVLSGFAAAVVPELHGEFTVGTGWSGSKDDFTAGMVVRRTNGSTETFFLCLADVAGSGDPQGDAVHWQSTTASGGITIADLTPAGASYPNLLVDGNIPPWLEDEQGLIAREVTFTAKAEFDILNSSGQPTQHVKDMIITVSRRVTNAWPGEYSSAAAVVPGENPADYAGLAQWIYDRHSALQHDGSVQLVEEEVGGLVGMGCRVNLTGGTGRYAAIAATVQQICEMVDTGTTAITFGAPNHLGPADLFEWLRAWRDRRRQSSPDAQSSNELVRSARTDAARNGRVDISVMGGESHTRIVIRQNGGAGIIDLDPSLCLGKTLQPREYSYCDNGVVKKVLLIGSEVYT